MNYLDLGYDGFLQKSLLLSARMSPAEARNSIPSGSLSAELLSAPLNAATDIIFSSSDGDTAAWTAGTIYFADGTSSGQIAAGDTSDIAATTYVYYDRDSPGALKTTTDPSTASGAQKLILAMVSEGVTGKDCKIIPTIGIGLLVSGIVASQIAAGTITAAEITVANLQALSANMGTVNVGGSGNGNGILNVKDTAGNNKVVLNSDGIAINSGKITIKNEDEVAIIDALGLRGSNVFSFDSVNNVSQRDISSASFVDVSNTTLVTADFSETKYVLVIMNVMASLYLNSTDQIESGEMVLNVDSSDKTGTIFDHSIVGVRMSTPLVFSLESANYSFSGTDILSLGSGVHTFKIRAKISGQNLRIKKTSIVFLVLGN